MFRSLRFRMAVSHAGAVLVILLVLGGIGQALLERSLNRDATSELRDAAIQQADRLAESGRINETPDSDLPAHSAVRVGVFRADGQPVPGPRERVPGWFHPSAERVVDGRVRLCEQRRRARERSGGGGAKTGAGRSCTVVASTGAY